MATVLVRSYESEDRGGLVRLWSEAFPDDPVRNAPATMIERKQLVQPELLLVALDGDAIVGAVMAGFDGTRGWIHHLAVSVERRRQGIGRLLMERAEAGLQALGCPKVNLQVRASNEGVISFYRAIGYEVEERVSLGRVLGESS